MRMRNIYPKLIDIVLNLSLLELTDHLLVPSSQINNSLQRRYKTLFILSLPSPALLIFRILKQIELDVLKVLFKPLDQCLSILGPPQDSTALGNE